MEVSFYSPTPSLKMITHYKASIKACPMHRTLVFCIFQLSLDVVIQTMPAKGNFVREYCPKHWATEKKTPTGFAPTTFLTSIECFNHIKLQGPGQRDNFARFMCDIRPD